MLTVLFAICVGCGDGKVYPISGQLVDTEGKPVTEMAGGSVEFDSVEGKTSANGSIDEQGRFRLTTTDPFDGAHKGKNRVAITRPYQGADTPLPPVIHTKYESFETSGLEVNVEAKSNDIKLTVERVK
jgi:hypothetical protein